MDCLERTHIDKVMVSYYATTDSVPVPLSYEHAKPFNRRGSGSLYSPSSAVSAPAGTAGIYLRQNTLWGSPPPAYTSTALVPALDQGSYYDNGQASYKDKHARYSSPPSKSGGFRSRQESTQHSSNSSNHNSDSRLRTPTSSRYFNKVDREPLSSPSQPRIHGNVQQFLSPFSKTKTIAQKNLQLADDACDNYLQSLQHYHNNGQSGSLSEDENVPNLASASSYYQPQQQEDLTGRAGMFAHCDIGPLGQGASNVGDADMSEYDDYAGDMEGMSQGMDMGADSGAYSAMPSSYLAISPFKFRSFSERTGNGGVTAGLVGLGGMGLSFSPGAMSKQLDSMKQHLSKYEEEPVPQAFHMRRASN